MGSAVTKSLRKEQLMVDVILNFNKASLACDNPDQEEKKFAIIVEKIQTLFKARLCDTQMQLTS